mmetsp:Transcript_27362/g.66634  ORF Transcript_27362/g.66634 Transcript_27362/m.66634 type:complete len:398 (-) Transcript_27362:1842-3035(-)
MLHLVEQGFDVGNWFSPVLALLSAHSLAPLLVLLVKCDLRLALVYHFLHRKRVVDKEAVCVWPPPNHAKLLAHILCEVLLLHQQPPLNQSLLRHRRPESSHRARAPPPRPQVVHKAQLPRNAPHHVHHAPYPPHALKQVQRAGREPPRHARVRLAPPKELVVCRRLVHLLREPVPVQHRDAVIAHNRRVPVHAFLQHLPGDDVAEQRPLQLKRGGVAPVRLGKVRFREVHQGALRNARDELLPEAGLFRGAEAVLIRLEKHVDGVLEGLIIGGLVLVQVQQYRHPVGDRPVVRVRLEVVRPYLKHLRVDPRQVLQSRVVHYKAPCSVAHTHHPVGVDRVLVVAALHRLRIHRLLVSHHGVHPAEVAVRLLRRRLRVGVCGTRGRGGEVGGHLGGERH